MYRKLFACSEYIKNITGDFSPQIAVILGSGLGDFADRINVKYSVDYSDIPGFPVSTVEGHNGRLIFGTYCKKNIVIAQGRVHLYEGYTPAETVILVRVLKLLGVETLIITNAAGGISKRFKPGDIMLITDHISMFIDSPLIGRNIDELGNRFPDMSEVYDKHINRLALSISQDLQIDLKTGVYAQLKGPQYETPAEIRALKLLGSDAVGMSTVIEAIAAKHCGMRVCGLSVITNMAAGINESLLSHIEVLENSKKAEKSIFEIIGSIIREIQKREQM